MRIPIPSLFVMPCCSQFTKGLEDAGHTNEVIDLYAIDFDPLLRIRDFAYWLPDENAPDVVEKVMKDRVLAGNTRFLQRIVAWSMFRKKSPLEVMTLLRKRGPRDVREQQEKVASAQALALISPSGSSGFQLF